ncbi:MAG: nucleotidyltransferase, partial [Euryarchaeota archaeon]|nr:nucleotidyltransferase [Euryarchaeota archaeon]
MKNNKQEIIIKLIEIEERPTIRQLSQETGIRYKNVYNIVKKLEKEDLISLEKVGNAYKCSINKKVHPLIFEAEFRRKENLIRGDDFKILMSKLNSLPFSFISLVFGSHAQKTASTGSDIDLMAIGESHREKEIERVISILPLEIHLTFFTYEEFLSMAQSREFSVVLEAIKSNI